MDLKDIKFRAKRKDTLDWEYGLPALDNTYPGAACILTFEPRKDLPESAVYLWCGFIPVLSYTICQYTGLKDRHGVEIWEHDLIKDTETLCTYEVIYFNGTFVLIDDSDIFNPQALPCHKKVDHNVIHDMLVVGSAFDGDNLHNFRDRRPLTPVPYDSIAGQK